MVNRERQRASRAAPHGPTGMPSEKTGAEEFYYRKQMAHRSTIVVMMVDGEELHGWIEWYDRVCFKLNRNNGPNLLVMKASVRYIYKQHEEDETVKAETAEIETSRKPRQA